MARREERAYREYVSDEQRSQPRGPQRGSRVGVEEGCPARDLCDESLLRDTRHIALTLAPSSCRRSGHFDEELRRLEHEQRVADAVDGVHLLVLRVDGHAG